MPGWENWSVKLSPSGWLGAWVVGSESQPRSLAEMPVTEWARSGPIQSQVTFSFRSRWTWVFDQAKLEIETRVLAASAAGGRQQHHCDRSYRRIADTTATTSLQETTYQPFIPWWEVAGRRGSGRTSARGCP